MRSVINFKNELRSHLHESLSWGAIWHLVRGCVDASAGAGILAGAVRPPFLGGHCTSCAVPPLGSIRAVRRARAACLYTLASGLSRCDTPRQDHWSLGVIPRPPPPAAPASGWRAHDADPTPTSPSRGARVRPGTGGERWVRRPWVTAAPPRRPRALLFCRASNCCVAALGRSGWVREVRRGGDLSGS